jgi:hypothetical protein
MSLDQYYTNPSIAKDCLDIVFEKYNKADYLIIEPSAGTGSFLSLCPVGSIGYDLEPKFPGIIEQDFLTVEIISGQTVMIVGNPPFGKNSTLAVQFFNHAATMSEVIAFILPRTFRKASIQNRLSRAFHLTYNEILPQNSFIFEGEVYDVPCVFQIWEKRDYERALTPVEVTHPDFVFTTADKADFAVQRVGVNAGRVKTDLTISPQSHYFIKGPVIDVFRALDFDRVKYDTAGNPSIAKSEIIALYREHQAK